MQSYHLVIVTDPNRQTLRLYYTQNIEELLYAINKKDSLFSSVHTAKMRYRIIYQEIFSNSVEVLARYNFIKHFTRMQLEKLVRKNNPNWLSLYSISRTNLLMQINRNSGKAIA